MPQVVLNGAGVVTVVRQLVAAAVPEHMGMNRKTHGGLLPRPGEELPEPSRRQGTAPFAREHIGTAGRPFPLQFSECPNLGASEGMHARRPPLQPMDVEPPLAQVHLIPAERDEFGHPEPVPVREEDHRGVAVAVAPPPLRCRHQKVHLPLGEVLAAAAGAVRHPLRGSGGSNCPIYRGWRFFLRGRVHAGVGGDERGQLSREGA